MGNVHGILDGITLEQLAEISGVKYDTLWRKARRIFPAEVWVKSSVVTAEQKDALVPPPAGSVRRKPAIKKTLPPPPPTEAKQPAVDAPPARFRLPSFGISEFLALAIYGHTFLVWYEIAIIFGMPGILAGVVVFALKHAAVVICRSGRFSDYVQDVLGVAFILDLLAVWAHHAAFADAMPSRFAAADGNIAAWVLGLVVAAGAFLSLYFTEKTAVKDESAI